MADINVGQLSDIINNKLDINCYNANPVTTPEGLAGAGMKFVVETYVNGDSGYRIWNDGYCEQWGRIEGSSNAYSQVFFFKNFSDIHYNLVTTQISSSVANDRPSTVRNRAINYMEISRDDVAIGILWKVSGYLADGEY